MADYGVQADAWGAMVMGKAELAPTLEQAVITNMKERGLSNFQVEKAKVALEGLGGESREHVVFRQDFGKGSSAAVALRMAPRGTQDLELSWRLFEKNSRTGSGQSIGQGGLIALGIGFIIIGIPLSALGVGLIGVCMGVILLGMGLGWWGKSRGKSTASAYGKFDSRALAQTVDYSLMRALSTLGVSSQELRILRQAQEAGIGNLAGVDHLANLPPPVIP